MTLSRIEDQPLLRGQGQFVHDIKLDNMLYAAFVRSNYAHAKITGPAFGVANAHLKEFSGVVAVLGPLELGAIDLSMPSINPMLKLAPDQRFPLLAIDKVSYVGQPIGLVIAKSAQQARAAADNAYVECTELPLHDEPAIHLRYGAPVGLGAPVGSPSAESLITVSTQHQQPRVIAMSLEPRATVAQWHDGLLTLWLPTQSPARARDDVAGMLGLAKDQVRVICPDVGGAFGSKATAYPEDFLVALAAKNLQSSISWHSSRSEEFLSGNHGRGGELRGSLTIDRQGKFQHLQATLKFSLGAWVPYSGAMPMRNAARILPGPYELKSVDIESVGRITNQSAVNIYRGAGRPEAALLMERLVELAAFKLGIDSVELRRRNTIDASRLPLKTLTGETLDSGNYREALDRACLRFGYEQSRIEQAKRRAAGELVGIGVALYIEPCGQGWESARIVLNADTTVTVFSGSSAQGQGHQTSYAIIAAQALGCSPTSVSVVQGDTEVCPDGIGALASRGTAIGGSAVFEAALQVKLKRDQGQPLPISAQVRYEAPGEAWSYGCIISQMCIDSETGVPVVEKIVWVDDAGHIVTPQLAKGQLLGGLAQGFGQAMMEQIVYDQSGQLITGSLMDYAVPRAIDMPTVEIESMVTKTEANSLGAKGVGEAGCIGVPASLLNAACDALVSFGISNLDFPLTSEKLWQAMQNKAN